jgi:hypothetical protein
MAPDPMEDRARIDVDTALLCHLGEIPIAMPYLQYQRTQQDDLNWKAAAYQDRQQGSSSGSPIL